MPDYTIDEWGIPYPVPADMIAGSDENLRLALKALADKTGQGLTQAVGKAVDEAVAKATPYRGYLPEEADFNSYGGIEHNGVWSISNARVYANNPLDSNQSGVLVVESGGYASIQTVQAYATDMRATRYQSLASSPRGWSEWGGDNFYRGIVPDGDDLNDYHTTQHSGIWRLANVRSYVNSPLDSGLTGLFVVMSNGMAVTHDVQRYASTEKYSRYQSNYVSHTYSAWKRADGNTEPGNGAAPTDPARLIAPLESRLSTVAFWGDSNTQKGGAVSRLNTLLPGSEVYNLGRSGQSARQIAARQGGYPSLMTVESDAIPASGTVTITDLTVRLLIQTAYPGLSTTGTLAGVHGTLTVEAGTADGYTFTRTTAGTVVECPPQTPFITDDAASNRESVCVFWTGGNYPADGVTEFNIGMAAHLTPAHKRFVVLANTTRSNEPQGTPGYDDNIREIEKGKAAFGERYIDIRAWMIANGLDVLGITPTVEDEAALAGDTIPPSLTTDGAHFTADAQRLVGEQIYARMGELGWV